MSERQPASPAPVLARLANVSHKYGRNVALQPLSLEFDHRVTGLLGPNGAGKTTLMELLTTRLRPRTGTVEVLGEDTSTRLGLEAVRRHFGVLPQHVQLVKSQKVLDAIAYSAWTNGLTRENAIDAALDAMDRMGIGDLAMRRVGKLSGGQRQQVGIAAAIAHRPALIVLDEPTVGLDPEFRMSLRQQLQELA